jgi:hypothetical protein
MATIYTLQTQNCANSPFPPFKYVTGMFDTDQGFRLAGIAWEIFAENRSEMKGVSA